MKQRLLCLLLVLATLLGACAITRQEEIETPFVLYYPKQTQDGSSVFLTQTVSLDAQNMAPDALLAAYSQAEPPQGASPAIPRGWTLTAAQTDGTTARLVFSGTPAGELKSSLAAACLTLTLTQLDSVERIELTAPDFEEAVTLSAENVLTEDTGMLPQQEAITLYLPDAQQRYLLRRRQTVEAMDASEKPQYVLQALLSHADSCIPSGTRLLGVTVENGICTVNFSSDFVKGMEKRFTCERLAVYSVVNTLTELEGITTVDFWIEGAPSEKLNFMSMQATFSADQTLLYAENATDVDLFVSCDGRLLVCLPQQLIPAEEEPTYMAVLRALLDFEGADGALRCIPKGTQVLSVRMEGTACVVDLTAEFLSGCKSEKEERLAMRSIIATLCALDEIESVEILVEGLEPPYRNAALKSIRRSGESWFAERKKE